MADQHKQSPEHQKAHDLAEEAIEKAAEGKQAEANRLAEEAKKIDPKIGDEMAQEIEADKKQAEKYQQS
jgi:uncharacterized low-complexity protein